MKHTLVFASLLAGTTGLGLAASSAISGTGWNEDLVIENTTAFDWGAVPGALSAGRVAGWAFYETGWGFASQGINNSGAYVGPSGTSYQMEAYNANNAILNFGTFTPSAAGQFSELAFLATHQATNGLIAWTATVNFSDASSTVLNGGGVDWINPGATEVVSANHGLANDSNQQFYDGTLSMVERTFTLSAADQLKTVTSIDLARTGGDNVVFHAISGEVVPEPATAALLGLGALGLLRRRRK